MFMHIRLVHKHLFTDHLYKLTLTVMNLQSQVHHRPKSASFYAFPIRHSDTKGTTR